MHGLRNSDVKTFCLTAVTFVADVFVRFKKHLFLNMQSETSIRFDILQSMKRMFQM